jgi:hypothetical protein
MDNMFLFVAIHWRGSMVTISGNVVFNNPSPILSPCKQDQWPCMTLLRQLHVKIGATPAQICLPLLPISVVHSGILL